MRGNKSAFQKVMKECVRSGPKIRWEVRWGAMGEIKIPHARYIISSALMRGCFAEMGFNPKRNAMWDFIEIWKDVGWIVEDVTDQRVEYIVTGKGLELYEEPERATRTLEATERRANETGPIGEEESE